MKEMLIELKGIVIDGGTQVRAKLDEDKVAEYADAMAGGDTFPPVTLFFDGSHYWLADGFHRYHAARRAHRDAIIADVRGGTLQEAQLFALGANSRHGLPLTQSERRDSVKRLLSHPLAQGWTNLDIARHVGVSPSTVGRICAAIEETVAEPKVKTFERNGKTVESSKMGRPRKQKEQAETTEEPPAELPAIPAAPVMDEKDQKIAELLDTIEELNAENQRLLDAVATGQWDATEIEKIDIEETVKELREQIRILEIDNAALRDSRDMFQARNAELMGTIKALQSKLKKLEA
jgi:hypothetical protein